MYKGCYTFTSKCYTCGGRRVMDKEIDRYRYLEHSIDEYTQRTNGEWIRKGCKTSMLRDISNIVFEEDARMYIIQT